jgi:hypothetical protein
MEIWECADCGCRWEVPVGTLPESCPREQCASIDIAKDPHKPGGMKPINWPGNW